VSLLYLTIRQARREGSRAARRIARIIPHLPAAAKPNLRREQASGRRHQRSGRPHERADSFAIFHVDEVL